MASAGNHRYAKALVFEESSDYNSGESNTLVCNNGILYFNGKQLSSNAGNQFDIFTANVITRTSGANIRLESNLVILPYTATIIDPSNSAGQGFQSDGEFLYYNGIQISAFSNIYQDTQPLTSNSITPLGNTSFVVHSNLIVDNVMFANTQTMTLASKTLHFSNTDSPQITFNATEFNFQPVSVGSNVQFLGALNDNGSDCNVNFVSTATANTAGSDVVNLKFKNKGDSTSSFNHTVASIKAIQSTPFNSSQGGGSMTLTCRNPQNGTLTADDQNVMLHMNTQPTGNTILIAPDTIANVGIMAGYTPSYRFQVGSNLYVDDTTNRTIGLGDRYKIVTPSNVWFQGGGDRVTIGSLTAAGEKSVVIGASAGTPAPANVVSIGFGHTGTLEANVVKIGSYSTATKDGSISIGNRAIAGEDGVAIGSNSHCNAFSVSLGIETGAFKQGKGCIAIGNEAGQFQQARDSPDVDEGAISIGYRAGNDSQGVRSVAIGNEAGRCQQGSHSVALGFKAGTQTQQIRATAIGHNAGFSTQGMSAVAVGAESGRDSQQANAVTIGYRSGYFTQNTAAVSIGVEAGYQGQHANSIAIGIQSGKFNQHGNAIAIGMQAGFNLQSERGIAMGLNAGASNQGVEALAIGLGAGQSLQGAATIGIGSFAGFSKQQYAAISIGALAGASSQNAYSIALGYAAAQQYQAGNAVAIGEFAGYNFQGAKAISIGYYAGKFSQNNYAVAIGESAGASFQGSFGVSIGYNAGKTSQNVQGIAIGAIAGRDNQGVDSIAIGTSAGVTSQGNYAIALGSIAGGSSQNNYAVSIGYVAGQFYQDSHSVAIGPYAGYNTQGSSAIAIGRNAGRENQGANAVAIGRNAGYPNQTAGSVAINGGYGNLPAPAAGFYINPVRASSGQSNVMSWNSVTKEITYEAAKTFVIEHPGPKAEGFDPTEHYLVHGCLEGPEGGVYYRGRGEVGKPVVLPKYVPNLIKGEPTIQVTPIYNGSVRTLNCSEYDIKTNSFEVFGSEGPFYWTFTAKRCDVNVEPLKAETNVNGNGPYLFTD